MSYGNSKGVDRLVKLYTVFMSRLVMDSASNKNKLHQKPHRCQISSFHVYVSLTVLNKVCAS